MYHIMVSGDNTSMQLRVSSVDEEEILKMRADYDQKMQDLVNKFKQEQESNAKLKVCAINSVPQRCL